MRGPEPEEHAESGKSNATYCGAESVEGCDLTPAHSAVATDAGFVLFLVSFDERCAGGKDGGKSEEQTSEFRPVLRGDQTCDNAN